jgi:hypothetical protein
MLSNAGVDAVLRVLVSSLTHPHKTNSQNQSLACVHLINERNNNDLRTRKSPHKR